MNQQLFTSVQVQQTKTGSFNRNPQTYFRHSALFSSGKFTPELGECVLICDNLTIIWNPPVRKQFPNAKVLSIWNRKTSLNIEYFIFCVRAKHLFYQTHRIHQVKQSNPFYERKMFLKINMNKRCSFSFIPPFMPFPVRQSASGSKT